MPQVRPPVLNLPIPVQRPHHVRQRLRVTSAPVAVIAVDAVTDRAGYTHFGNKEIPPTEIIGVLETAKACVISQAIKELQGEE